MDGTFDPNGIGIDNGNYFGMPFTPEESALVLMSACWDVTTSYGGGASAAPTAIIAASLQVDLYDKHNPGGWEKGIGTLDFEDAFALRNDKMREEAKKVIAHLAAGGKESDEYVQRKLQKINTASEEFNSNIYETAKLWLDKGKKVGLVGGDHSTPYGLIKATAEKEGSIGILHIDAHADLREAYEGFKYSHASIMYNVINNIPEVSDLVQVGVRDFCDDELALARSNNKITMFDDYTLNEMLFAGEHWGKICTSIVDSLPQKVYVSFDIDGLSPENCPNTGTPVPGGLSFHQAVFLLSHIVESGRKIVGFDLTEVSPGDNEWDANVGARILYKLCNMTLK